MAEQAETGSPVGSRPDGGHVLAELVSSESLTAPISASGRIKYTSIGVSKRYIGLGASSGGLYIFHRTSLKYLQVFSNAEGALTRVLFAPDDNIVGIATSQGHVIAWELNMEKRERPTRLAASAAHRHGDVTGMAWDAASERLFSGDDRGRITFLNVFHRKMSGLFKLPTELVMDADSPVVQLDFYDDKLLASTTTKCFICDTKKKHAYSVGTKPRDGQFGACFLQKPDKEFPLIYSARPGSRMWEVNIVGQVQATHQFKHLLVVPSMPVLGPGHSPVFPTSDQLQKPQSLSFSQLVTFGHGYNFLLSWTKNAVYVFDPARVKVIVWSTDFKDILWASVYKSTVYCLHPNSQVGCYSLLSVERCISKLFALGQWAQCGLAAVCFAGRVRAASSRRLVPRSLLQEVNYQLMDGCAGRGQLSGRLEALLGDLEADGDSVGSGGSSRRSSLESAESLRLESGVYRVRNRTCSEGSAEGDPLSPGYRPGFVDGRDAVAGSDCREDEESAVLHQELEDIRGEFGDGDGGGRVNGLGRDGAESGQRGDYHGQDGGEGEGEEEGDGAGVAPMTGPAGINWGFGQGRLSLRRDNSLLEEIAEALVKDGELDTGIAESLSDAMTGESALYAHHGDRTQPTNDSEGEMRGASRDGSCSGRPIRSETFGGLTKRSAGEARTSLPSPAASDQLGTEPAAAEFQLGMDLAHADRPFPGGRSQSGELGVDQAAPSPQSADGESVAPLPAPVGRRRSDELAESTGPQVFDSEGTAAESTVADFGSEPVFEAAAVTEQDWPAIRRSVSVPTASQGPSTEGKKGRRTSTGRDKRRSKKSRIIDFDNVEKPTKPSPVSTATSSAREAQPKQQSKMVLATTAPIKPSQSATATATSPPPTSPSKAPGRAEHPYSGAVDLSGAGSFSTGGAPGSGAFHSTEEMFMGGPMLMAMSGPRLAAHILAPSLSAMKESLSSGLVKTKTFLKQMSEGDVGASGSGDASSTGSPPRHVPSQATPVDAQWDPSLAPLPDQPSSPTPTSPRPDETSHRLALPANSVGVGPQTRGATPGSGGARKLRWFDESEAKETYCDRVGNDTVLRSLALTTWKTKQQLQDLRVLLSAERSRDVLEKWLRELRSALASRRHRGTADGHREVSSPPADKDDYDRTGTGQLRDAGGEAAGEAREGTVSGDGTSPPKSGHLGRPLSDAASDPGALRGEAVLGLPWSRSGSPHWLSDPLRLPAEILADLSWLAGLCFEMDLYGDDEEEEDDNTVLLSGSAVRAGSPSGGGTLGSSSPLPPEADRSHPVSDRDADGCRPAPSVKPPPIGHGGESPEGRADEPTPDRAQSSGVRPGDGVRGWVSGATPETPPASATQDARAARFVSSLSFLLDVGRVRSVLNSREGQRRQTMAAILDCLEALEGESDGKEKGKGRHSKTDRGDHGAGSHAGLLHIHRLIHHGEAEVALEVMLGSFPDLTPWEVAHLACADTMPASFFLDYVTALLDSVEPIDRETLLASICSDQEVKCQVLTSALTQGAPPEAELFCNCRQRPRPGSHTKQWRYGTLADQVLSLPAANKDRLLQLCSHHGYWNGLMRLLAELNKRAQAMDIALQLSDLDLFTKDGLMPRTMEEWIHLLNQMSRSLPDPETVRCLSCLAPLLTNRSGHWTVASATGTPSPSYEDSNWSPAWDGSAPASSKPECDWPTDENRNLPDRSAPPSDWSPQVTWRSVAPPLVRAVGPGLAARMLQDTSLPGDQLTRDFFTACIHIAIMEKYQKSTCQSILETQAVYLWSKRNQALSPWLHRQTTGEPRRRQRATPPRVVDLDATLSKVSGKESGSSQDSFQFAEDLDCHWGTSCLLNRDCEVCGLALPSSVSVKSSGLMVFPCGHAFHAACVVEKLCLLCYETSCHTMYADSRYA